MKREFLRRYARRTLRVLERKDSRFLADLTGGKENQFERKICGSEIMVSVELLESDSCQETYGISVSSLENWLSCYIPVSVSFPVVKESGPSEASVPATEV